MTTQTLIDCGDSLDINHAGALQARLLDALKAGHPVFLRCREVARVDGAGLQLLAVFIRTARASRVDYRWREPSHALQQAAALLGLSRELELPAS